MCCFAGHVRDVSDTNIFARVKGDREYLVYEMTFTSDEQTAMILPIPIAPGASEGAVEFIALDDYPGFFRDFEAHFKELWSDAVSLGGMPPPRVALKVQLVGALEASFVPCVNDLDRLDDRFRIPEKVWAKLPAYASFGFVVFKLQAGKHVNVHPMAFSFPTRDPGTVFFPTVHIHDGSVHGTADLDHVLYTQNKPASPIARGSPPLVWIPSDMAASRYLRTERTRDLVDPDAPCFRSSVVGSWKNSDVLVRM